MDKLNEDLVHLPYGGGKEGRKAQRGGVFSHKAHTLWGAESGPES